MKTLASITLILCCAFSVNAQKVKYKDLYVLLRAKKYKDGAGFLYNFLATNPEHPNANYQMGLMLEFKLSGLDLLKESEAIIQRADSAILYFDKAYALINEKEVKKHDDDYYELFKRRNLRTGKFEVILSDVQLDIENRKSVLVTQKSNIKAINSAFGKSVSLYDSALNSYQKLKKNYTDVLTLGFGATDITIKQIEKMIVNYDSSLINFKQYKKLNKQFGRSSDETIITFETLQGFEDKGLKKPDFYGKKVDFIDFTTWGKSQLEQIKTHHQLLVNLIQFDESLESLNTQVLKDSVDLSSEIFKKITSPALKELKGIDSGSLVYKLLNYKIGQLNLNSAFMTWYNSYADTVDVGLQVHFVSNLENELESIKLLQSSLRPTDEGQFVLRYKDFVDARYTTLEGLNTFLSAQFGIIKEQEETINQLVAIVNKRDDQAYSNSDTIPLLINADSLGRYHTFYIDSLENRILKIAGLVNFNSKNELFFAIVPSSRQVDSLYKVETDLTLENIIAETFFVEAMSAISGNSIFLIGNRDIQKYTLIYFSEKVGILWNNPVHLEGSSSPQLTYTEGQILISQEDKVLRCSLENGITIEQ